MQKKKKYLTTPLNVSGDSCCFSFSLGQIKTIIEEQIPGVYVKSVRIGNNEIEVSKPLP